MTILDDGTRPIFSDVVPAQRGASALEPMPREWTWLNWALSLLTAPIAALTMGFALTRAAGSALCTSAACPYRGVNGSLFELLYYAPAVVAALTLFLAFFFATARPGIAVWVCGWVLLSADWLTLLTVF